MRYDHDPRVEVRETRTIHTSSDSAGTAILAFIVIALLAVIGYFFFVKEQVADPVPPSPPIVVPVPTPIEPAPPVILPAPVPDTSVDDARRAAEEETRRATEDAARRAEDAAKRAEDAVAVPPPSYPASTTN